MDDATLLGIVIVKKVTGSSLKQKNNHKAGEPKGLISANP
jgi:hypothetical protein